MKNLNVRKSISVLLVLIFVLSTMPSNEAIANTNGLFNLSITESSEINGRKDIQLDWEDKVLFSGSNNKYVVARQKIESDGTVGKWEFRGKYSNSVKVLNVYPDRSDSDQLSSWLDDLTKQYSYIQIETDKVGITDFNSNYNNYLIRDTNGNYNYDVIVFGFWDTNNKKDLTVSSANEIQNFINTGGGVLLGHDTVQHSTTHPIFKKLAEDNMDLKIIDRDRNIWTYSTEVAVEKQGSVTTYPFDINNENLKIPLSHTLSQLPLNEDDVYMTFQKNLYENGEGPFFQYNLWGPTLESNKESTTNSDYGGTYRIDSYLTMSDNVAIIQCGHASGKTTIGEQKILANVIYSLANIHYETTAVDQILDEKRPDIPTYSIEKNEIVFDSTDYGNDYRYRIIALPFEDAIPTLDSNLINALENENTYNNGRVVFSNFQYAKVGGTLKEFNYIINKKDTMDSVKGGEVLSLISSNTSEVYSYANPTTGRINIKDDDFMHIVAVDNALNVSQILTINLWDETPDVTPITRFKGLNDDDIFEDEALKDDKLGEPQKYGTLFAPIADNIKGYVYYKSAATDDVNNIADLDKHESETSIILTNENNVITHIYQQPVTRELYLVEHKTLGLENPDVVDGIMSVHYYATRNGIMYLTDTFQVPTFVNYNFRGYYTQQPDDSLEQPTPGDYADRVEVVNNEAEVILGDDNKGGLFAHYTKKVGGSIVEFFRMDDEIKTVLGDYEEKGYAGEAVNIKGTDIETEMVKEILDIDNYTNKHEVVLDRTVVLKQGHEGSEIHHSIELNPRRKTVEHYYVNFKENPTEVTLFGTDDVRYKDINTPQYVQLRYDGSTEWKPFENVDGLFTSSSAITLQGKEIDFTDPSDTVMVGYYKGTKPSEGYDYTINYVNKVDGKLLENKTSGVNIPAGMKIDIPVERGMRNDAYTYADGRDVKFIPVGVKITDGTGRLVEEYSVNYEDEFIKTPEIFPEPNFTDEYVIEVLYEPISEVIVTAKIVYVSGNSAVVIDGSEVTYTEKVLYGKDYKVQIGKTYDLETHKVERVKIEDEDDVTWPNVEDEFYVKLDDYTDFTHIVEVSYVEKTFDLTINTFDAYNNNQFEKIEILETPIYETVDFVIPKMPGYDLDFKLIDDTGDKMSFSIVKDDTEQLVISITDNSGAEIGKIIKDKIAKFKTLSFYPNAETTKSDGFQINLYYKPISKFQKEIYHVDGTLIKKLPEEQYYLGDEIEVTIKDINDGNYNIDANTYEIAYGYLDNKKYENLSIGQNHILTANKVAHEVDLYYKPKTDIYTLTILTNNINAGTINNGISYGVEGAEHFLSAIPNEGYDFVEWELIKGEFSETSIADIYAGYTEITLGGEDVKVKAIFEKENTDGGTDGGTDNNGSGSGNNIKQVNNNDKNKEEDIKDYHYKPFIVGYNDNTVGPENTSQRIEFIRMIYNLFAIPNLKIDRSSLENYPDVEDDVWYSEALAFCINIGIVEGFSDGTMRPNAEITRAEMAVMLVKLMDYLNMEYENTVYEDFSDIEGHWAEYYIHILYNSGIAHGMIDGTFHPDDKISRAEVVAFMNRTLNRDVTQYENSVTFADLPKTYWAYNDIMNAANGVNPKQYEIEHINKKD